MGTIVGRGIRVEVGKTEGLPITITSVSNDKPGVATKVAHGLNDKAIGYFTGVTGMSPLDGQACRVANKTADTFELENLNTTGFPAYTAGSWVPITAWATLFESTSYAVPDGSAEELDDTGLIDDIKQVLNGLLNAQTVQIGVKAQEELGEAMELVEDAAANQGYLVFRITFKSGAVRFWRGQPTLPGENVQKGALGTGSINTTVKGRFMRGAA